MKANPAGILMIGIGVVLLNLAYTGRGAAVWRAITGADAAPAGDTGNPDSIEPDPRTNVAGEAFSDDLVPSYHDRDLWGVVSHDGGIVWGAR